MIYVLADGSSKDVLVGDWIVVGPDSVMIDGNTVGYQVVAFDAIGVNIGINDGGQTRWQTMSVVTAVWRKL